MAKMEDNTVSSENQRSKEESIFGKEGSGKKILFLGNSITLHAPSPTIGWYNNWGMAASSIDKDYVHQTMKMVWEQKPETSFLVAQIAPWEREFWNEQIVDDNFAEAVNYDADIIIMRAVENMRDPDIAAHDFEAGYCMLLDKMNKSGKADIVLTSSFWDCPARDKRIKGIAEKRGYKYVHLADLGGQDKYTAKGLFEHSGVAAHPGDLGMLVIAERIFDAIKEYIW